MSSSSTVISHCNNTFIILKWSYWCTLCSSSTFQSSHTNRPLKKHFIRNPWHNLSATYLEKSKTKQQNFQTGPCLSTAMTADTEIQHWSTERCIRSSLDNFVCSLCMVITHRRSMSASQTLRTWWSSISFLAWLSRLSLDSRLAIRTLWWTGNFENKNWSKIAQSIINFMSTKLLLITNKDKSI